MLTPFRGTIGSRVPGAGPLDAKIAFVAEAPGSEEEDLGVPLIGKSGQFLFDGLAASPWPGVTRMGLGRDVVRLENVIETRPPDNDLDVVSLASMEKGHASLQERLSPTSMPNLELVVPMGNCALNALLRSPLKQRKKRAGGHEWKWPHTISAWRGSVNKIEVAGREVTMIPTFHPAYFLYGEGANFQAWRADWIKIKRAYEEGIEISPKLNTIVAPSWKQIEIFDKLIQHSWHREGKQALLALDIETVGPIIDCVGFCVDGETTLTLPLLPQLWPCGNTDVRRAWGYFQRWMEHDIPKGTWFGYYDIWRILRQKGWAVKRWWWDGFNLHHLFDPADDHSLAYAASRELDVPFWKHIGKEEAKKTSAAVVKKRDWKERHRYCGFDVGYTFHIIRKLQAKLQKPWEKTWRLIA